MEAIRREGRQSSAAIPTIPSASTDSSTARSMAWRSSATSADEAPLVVCEAVWQYSHHVLPGLVAHKGPILTVANWSGEWPGLVGMLNLNGCLTKAGVKYSTLWSGDFTDKPFLNGLRQWLTAEKVRARPHHVRPLDPSTCPPMPKPWARAGRANCAATRPSWASSTKAAWACTTPSFPTSSSMPLGVFKERLSQSALYAAMRTVSDARSAGRSRLAGRQGHAFLTGPNPETDLTDDQILDQCKMYIAALRIADDFGCDVIGIQYQQGLKDLAPASDLAEGLLNNVDRPPVSAAGKRSRSRPTRPKCRTRPPGPTG